MFFPWYLAYQPVQVGIAGSLYVQVPPADVVEMASFMFGLYGVLQIFSNIDKQIYIAHPYLQILLTTSKILFQYIAHPHLQMS